MNKETEGILSDEKTLHANYLFIGLVLSKEIESVIPSLI